MPIPRRRAVLSLLAVIAVGAPALSAQGLLDRIKKQVDVVNEATRDVRGLQCDVQGPCGTIRQSEDFAPARYSSLAVTATDASRMIPPGTLGRARQAFEGQLIENGYLIAPSTNLTRARALFDKDEGSWSDDELRELAEFVTGIDAVIVLEVTEVGRSNCRLNNRYAAEATVALSARWLNTPAGDVPWVGSHSATVCTSRQSGAISEALDKVAGQLASNLPTRRATRP